MVRCVIKVAIVSDDRTPEVHRKRQIRPQYFQIVTEKMHPVNGRPSAKLVLLNLVPVLS